MKFENSAMVVILAGVFTRRGEGSGPLPCGAFQVSHSGDSFHYEDQRLGPGTGSRFCEREKYRTKTAVSCSDDLIGEDFDAIMFDVS